MPRLDDGEPGIKRLFSKDSEGLHLLEDFWNSLSTREACFDARFTGTKSSHHREKEIAGLTARDTRDP